ncbi:MAG: glycosyltransferase family 2 protein [Proteobacteria bacterium]|nr:glycosyltransferase family 2 protein [Pseudomonadota bacterium]MBU1648131.1 glycosyltransferase family 2 protein [Pseudomonadota bacterium]
MTIVSGPPAIKIKGEVDEITLSVIIVNYNGQPFLETCLRALSQNLSCRYEIIVVDNNSDDGSQDYLSKTWPGVQLICSPDNLGFARGNNYGAEQARGRFLLLLNNDTKMLEPFQPLLDYLDTHPDTAVVGGRLRNPDGSVQSSVGYEHTPYRILLSWMLPRSCAWFSGWQIHEKRPEFYEQTHQEVDWVSGAFLCIRRRIWKELSGFDRDIFMYCEDSDLCRRVRERGQKVAYVAVGDTCHFEGGGKKGMSGHALFTTCDSYRLLLKKRYGSLIRNLTCAGLSLVFLVRAVLYLLSGTMSHDLSVKTKAGFYLRAAGRLLSGNIRSLFDRSTGDGKR